MTAAIATAPLERQSVKAQQILDAASRIFMEQGFGATSMDAVARGANVSKATLYAHFTSKEQLFAEMIAAACRQHAAALTPPELGTEDVRTGLTQFGRGFLHIVLSPRGLAIYRVVVAEAPRFPELGRAFYEAGPRMVIDLLASYLQQATERRVLAVPDPRLDAWQFVGMIRNELLLRGQLGIAPASEDEIERTVASGVEVFLRAYAA
jgi:AcrR family transcriptional regulator